jgi:hypothetical protein
MGLRIMVNLSIHANPIDLKPVLLIEKRKTSYTGVGRLTVIYIAKVKLHGAST